MRVWLPKPGYSANPMIDFPRNDPCPCKSENKFKKCCYLKQPLFIETDVSKGLKTALENYKKRHNKK